MAKLKVSELFYSIQGEGRYAGVPSLFLRTFGCSLRCPGFSRDHSVAQTPNPEVAQLIADIPKFKEQGLTFSQLPLAKTGCDTYAAVYPEFKDFSPMMTTEEIAAKIKATMPGQFNTNRHLVITGGEPLLPGWQKAYPALVEELIKANLYDNSETGDALYVTFETNGTQKIDTSAFDSMYWNCYFHFSVSPKLAASGEKFEDAIKPELVREYFKYGVVDFKFVVETPEHVQEVARLFEPGGAFYFDLDDPIYHKRDVVIYLMPVGGTNEVYSGNRRAVAEQCMKYGFRYSPRLQNDLFENEWGT